MNLNISYNWLKEYVKTDLSAYEFAKRISLVGPSVDHITKMKPNFDKVVVGQIMKIDIHPDADKLHVCKVNVGKQELQIVCGANNIKEGQKVPVVLVGGRVGDFEIKAAKIRGVESFGMMCSQKELGLGEDHSGIFILPEDAKIGEPLEKIMPLNDYILDVEVTSNRPDAMSIVGLAEEASAALGVKNMWQMAKPNLAIKGDKQKLAIKVAEKKLCPRYQAIVMTDIKVKSSPLWMQQRLIASGLRPINNLVDITNYILLEYGQPMHVFDYDKLLNPSQPPLSKRGGENAEINVRMAKAGEKILALDGKEYELAENQLVIADKSAPVAVAGVMGGELSAATNETKTIVFECANFDSVSVRKTSRALNLRSDSSNLYEKGISPENTLPALMQAIQLAQEIAGAKVASEIIDEKSYKHKDKTIKLSLSRVNMLLGVDVSSTEIKKSLEALGFVVKIKSKNIMDVIVPWWRDSDILGDHDLIEEVARMHGYGNLPTKIMATELPVNYDPADDEFYWEDKIKDFLAGFGLTEIYTYSFISEKAITNAGFDPKNHIRITNPLSADFEYMRTSLAPGALQIIAENQGLFPESKLFDLSKVYLPQGANDLAVEKFKLLIAVYGNDAETVFKDAKGIGEGLLQRLNISCKNELAVITIVDAKTKSACGLKKNAVLVEFDFDVLKSFARTAPEYKPIPKFPAIELDLSMEIDNAVTFAEAANAAYDAAAPLVEKVDFLSAYQGDKVPEGKKALAIRIVYRDLNKTLELKEAQDAHEKVVDVLKKSYNIVVR
ncbi:MAG: phenylalanine--tRNA ligase subunit beta [Candidatus Buchananbacteria bacterium]